MHSYVDMRPATTPTLNRTQEAGVKKTLPEGNDAHCLKVLDPDNKEMRPQQLVDALDKAKEKGFLNAQERQLFEETHTLGPGTQQQQRGGAVVTHDVRRRRSSTGAGRRQGRA
mmetsp:Transcript_56885/g.83254  ORF Transcript_56885/g.83254 Transcript_56885/m.83254 type:complete len:113 (-) Transcript_56885:386-724(-)